MIQFKPVKVLLLCAFAASIAACGQKAEDSTSVLSQNEGVLRYVPAETPYLLAMPESLPEDVLDKFEANTDRIISAYETAIEASLSDAASALEATGQEEEEVSRFMTLAGELVGLMHGDRLQEAGISRNPQMAIYGVGLLPVMRVSLADADAFAAKIAEIEESAGKELSVGEIEGRPYWYVDEDGARLIVGIFDNQLVATIVPSSLSEESIDDVLGLELPNASIAQSGALADLAENYDFTPYVMGFFDVERVVETFLEDASGVNGDLLKLMDYDASMLSEVCRNEIRDMSGVMPRIVSGYTEIGTTQMRSNTVLELRSDLTSGLASLAAPVPGLGADLGDFASFGAGLDIMAAREFFKTSLDSIAADPFECELFADLQDALSQGQFALNQPLPPFVSGFRGVHAVIDTIEGFDFTSEQPVGKFEARLLVAIENAEELLAMGAMFMPQLASLDLQPNGDPVKLDLPQIPEQFEPVYVAMRDRALAIAIGDSSSARLGELLNAPAGDPPPLFSMHVDGSRYYELIGEVFEAAKTSTIAVGADREVSPEMEEAFTQLMTGFSEAIDRVSVDMTFTERGIEFPASISLPD